MLALWVDQLLGFAAGALAAIRQDERYPSLMSWAAFTTDWMPEPCRSCDRREVDWGGCRCQALALTGEAANTDPACALSPRHDEMLARMANGGGPRLLPGVKML